MTCSDERTKGCICVDVCDGLDFEDAISDGDAEACEILLPTQLPAIVPTGAVVLSEMRTVQKTFKTNQSALVPLTEDVMNCRDAMAKEAPPLFAFSRLLAEDQRCAIWSLYGVCRAFTEVKTHEELNNMRGRLHRVFNADLRFDGNPDGVWGALRTTLNRYTLIR